MKAVVQIRSVFDLMKSSLWDYLRDIQGAQICRNHAHRSCGSRTQALLQNFVQKRYLMQAIMSKKIRRLITHVRGCDVALIALIHTRLSDSGHTLDVATSAVAVVGRVSGTPRTVAVTGTVDFALNDHAVTVIAVMVGNQKCEDGGDEEEDDVLQLC